MSSKIGMQCIRSYSPHDSKEQVQVVALEDSAEDPEKINKKFKKIDNLPTNASVQERTDLAKHQAKAKIQKYLDSTGQSDSLEKSTNTDRTISSKVFMKNENENKTFTRSIGQAMKTDDQRTSDSITVPTQRIRHSKARRHSSPQTDQIVPEDENKRIATKSISSHEKLRIPKQLKISQPTDLSFIRRDSYSLAQDLSPIEKKSSSFDDPANRQSLEKTSPQSLGHRSLSSPTNSSVFEYENSASRSKQNQIRTSSSNQPEDTEENLDSPSSAGVQSMPRSSMKKLRMPIYSADDSLAFSSNKKRGKLNSRLPSSNDNAPIDIERKRNGLKTSRLVESLDDNSFDEQRKSNQHWLMTFPRMASSDRMTLEDRLRIWRQHEAEKIQRKRHFSYFYGFNR